MNKKERDNIIRAIKKAGFEYIGSSIYRYGLDMTSVLYFIIYKDKKNEYMAKFECEGVCIRDGVKLKLNEVCLDKFSDVVDCAFKNITEAIKRESIVVSLFHKKRNRLIRFQRIFDVLIKLL